MKAPGYTALKGLAYAACEPLMRRASRAYVPGPQCADALHWARHQAPHGVNFTFGYFNAEGESSAEVEAGCTQAIHALALLADGYCSVKAPALSYDADALRRLAAQAAAHGQRLHFDSHGPETASPTLAALAKLRPDHPRLGLTLPGRWRRSLEDASWAAAHGLRVRVVKGQWPCPQSAHIDPRKGFLAVIDRLAGQVEEAAVATHDAALALEAARRLRARGTRCELELLCGLPRAAVMRLAREATLPVRMYIPFGQAWLPYALGQVLRQPRLWPRLLKDSLAESWQAGA
jgi:proline dehydrogenase